MATERLTKAYKNHPAGTELHNVNPRLKRELKALGVIGGRKKAVRKPARNKMVADAPEAKAETNEEGGESPSPSTSGGGDAEG